MYKEFEMLLRWAPMALALVSMLEVCKSEQLKTTYDLRSNERIISADTMFINFIRYDGACNSGVPVSNIEVFQVNYCFPTTCNNKGALSAMYHFDAASKTMLMSFFGKEDCGGGSLVDEVEIAGFENYSDMCNDSTELHFTVSKGTPIDMPMQQGLVASYFEGPVSCGDPHTSASPLRVKWQQADNADNLSSLFVCSPTLEAAGNIWVRFFVSIEKTTTALPNTPVTGKVNKKTPLWTRMLAGPGPGPAPGPSPEPPPSGGTQSAAPTPAPAPAQSAAPTPGTAPPVPAVPTSEPTLAPSANSTVVPSVEPSVEPTALPVPSTVPTTTSPTTRAPTAPTPTALTLTPTPTGPTGSPPTSGGPPSGGSGPPPTGGGQSGSPSASPTMAAYSFCKTFTSVMDGPIYYCGFQVCGTAAVTVTVSTCSTDGSTSGTGTVQLTVYNETLSVAIAAGSNTDDDGCASLSFVADSSDSDNEGSDTCQWYNIHQNCTSATCGATVMVVNGTVSVAATQKFALLSLVPMTYSYQQNYLNWTMDSDIRDWPGITVDSSNYVTDIDMTLSSSSSSGGDLSGGTGGSPSSDYGGGSGSGDDDLLSSGSSASGGGSISGNSGGSIYLVGQLSDHVFPNLPRLESFSISDNSLTGTIPPTISYCTKLESIDLSSNALTGTLPNVPANLVSLTLTSNSISGTISWLPYTLQDLYIGANLFEGTLPTFNALEYVEAYENAFSGDIPLDDNSASSLALLSLQTNILTGTLGTVNIQTFNVNDNLLTGTLPPLRADMVTAYLLVGSNYLQGTIAGTFPTGLTSMDLSYNSFNGSLPSMLQTALTSYYIEGNQFTGRLPDFPSNVKAISAENNQFTGPLPALPAFLHTLTLSNNMLTGTISLNGSADITEVSLGNNLFTGPIMTFPTSLTVFKVNDNLLTGEVPYVLSDETFIDSSSLENIDISNNPLLGGVLPNTLCSWTRLHVVKALGCNITCYESCYPVELYMDYMTDYDMSDDSTVPNYKVCVNNQSRALCDLNAKLNILDNIQSKEEYLAESTVNSVTPFYTISNVSDGMSIQYSYSDMTTEFSRFEVGFNMRSLEAYNYITHVSMFCADTAGGGSSTWHNYTSLPGVGQTGTFSSASCEILDIFLSISNPNQVTGTLGTVSFTVERYSYKEFWDCDFMDEASTRRKLSTVDGAESSVSSTSNPCGWVGIECDQNSVVTSLSLSNVYLEGTLPASIGVLSWLTYLDLSNNLITGSLPDDISNLIYLSELDISNNKFTALSSSLATLTNLTVLNINSNELNGTLPEYLSELPLLTQLQFRSNSFSGTFPQSLCALNASLKVSAQDNRFLCGTGCTDIIWLGDCASPTAMPTHEPTQGYKNNAAGSTLSNGEIAAVVVCIVVFMALLGAGYRFWRKRRAYAKLPQLHRYLTDKRLIDVQEAELYADKIHLQDKSGRTFLEALVERNLFDCITPTALATIVLSSLPVPSAEEEEEQGEGNDAGKGEVGRCVDSSDVDCKANNDEAAENGKANENFKSGRQQGQQAWGILIQQVDEVAFDALKQVLAYVQRHRTDDYVKRLVTDLDATGRRYIDIASPRARAELLRCLYLHRRFEVHPGPAKHKSATSLVVFAIDHGAEDSSTMDDDQKEKGIRVVLKFMKHRHQFLSELVIRQRGNFDSRFVITVLDNFDAEGDLDSSRSKEFLKSAAKAGYGEYPYCLVMPLADTNLQSVIDRRHIAGEDWDNIKLILKTLCNCLIHIHDKGIMHGDLKPNNLVLIDNAIRLIDFDSSCWFGEGSTDYAGAKFSSGYLPPELFHDHGRCIKQPHHESDNTSRSSFSYDYELVRPCPSQDMWAVGVVLYLLCTGFHLFPTSVEGHADKSDFKHICDWTSETKAEKLSKIEHLYARNLISQLLHKNPAMRPDAGHVLSHPFFTGKAPARLIGEEPEYDVFLSYRVSSDADLAEFFFNELTTKYELRVWWDKVRLEAGQKWEEGFCNGLLKSRCFVCLMSKNAVFNPTVTRNNFAALNKESPCDNVLLEWRLALELRARNVLEGVFPIMIGERGDVAGAFGSVPPRPALAPGVFVEAVEEKLREHLDNQGLGTPVLHLAVDDVVKQICANQGGFLKGDLEVASPRICGEIQKMVGKCIAASASGGRGGLF